MCAPLVRDGAHITNIDGMCSYYSAVGARVYSIPVVK